MSLGFEPAIAYTKRMAKVSVVEALPASAASVWKRIEDFGDLSAWAPQATLESIEGSGQGAVRRVQTEFGLFHERCEAHDPQALSFSYRLLDSPLPYDDYVAVVTLTPQGDDACEIEWRSTFAVREGTEADAEQNVALAYRHGFIASLRKSIEAGP